MRQQREHSEFATRFLAMNAVGSEHCAPTFLYAHCSWSASHPVAIMFVVDEHNTQRENKIELNSQDEKHPSGEKKLETNHTAQHIHTFSE